MAELSNSLYEQVRILLLNAKSQVRRSIDNAMVYTYFEVGRLVVEDEQKGSHRAEYGQEQIKHLSAKLSKEFGKGFSVSNLRYMRAFYRSFEKHQTVSGELSWSHYVQLIRLDDERLRLALVHFNKKRTQQQGEQKVGERLC